MVIATSTKARFWFFLALTIAAYLLMRFLTHNLSSKTIIEFEIAKTVDNARALMAGWGQDGSNIFLKGIYGDFLFIVGYSGALFYGCRFMGKLSGHFILSKAGYVFSFLAIIAGICDVIENIGMIYTIRREPVAWLVHLTSDMARIKFSLIFIMLLYIIVCLLFWGIDRLMLEKKRPIL